MDKLEQLIVLVGEVKIRPGMWPNERVCTWINPHTYHLELETGGSVEGAVTNALSTAVKLLP